jgi:hypothetical protein
MTTLERRLALVAGPLAVAFWAAGLIVGQALPTKIPSHPTDAQLLTWVQGNKNPIILGGFLFAVGCAVFLWFAAMLRSRLAAAEGETHTFSSLVFGAAIGIAVLGTCMQGDMASALNADSVSAATAGTLHNTGDVFFIGAEVLLFAFLVGAAVVAFRTRALPRWWASVAAFVGVVALIGPIGWLALIFGLPVVVLGTTFFLARKPVAARSGRREIGEAVAQAL